MKTKKNIFLLSTDKPSRLAILGMSNTLQLFDKPITFKTFERSTQNIYITNDEEIKKGDYWIYICPINGLDYGDNHNPIVKNILPFTWFEKLHDKGNYKKIILTTDQDLIKDGVQAINDDFLEWFVKNPNCEFVELQKGFPDGSSWGYNFLDYKITIPQEEPKQEMPIINGSYGCIIETNKQETLEEPENITLIIKNFEEDYLKVKLFDKDDNFISELDRNQLLDIRIQIYMNDLDGYYVIFPNDEKKGYIDKNTGMLSYFPITLWRTTVSLARHLQSLYVNNSKNIKMLEKYIIE